MGQNVTDESRVLHVTGIGSPRTALVDDTDVWIRLTSKDFNYNPFAGFKMQLTWLEMQGR